MPSDEETVEVYRGECPMCGQMLLGVTKADLVDHLRENDETLAGKMVENDTFAFEDCAGATPEKDGGFVPTQYDSKGAQRHRCEDCGEETDHTVWVRVGANGEVSKRRCRECGRDSVARHVTYREDTDAE